MPKISRLDFPIAPKIYKPKKTHVIKREVMPSELLLLRHRPKVTTKKLKLPPEKFEAKYTVMPSVFSFKKLIPQASAFLSCLLIAAMVLQIFSYIGNAKKSSSEILGVATSAYSDLDNATKSLESQDFAGASQLFESAQSNLNAAVEKLNRYKFLTWIVPQANSADHLLDGANLLAQGGSRLTQALALYNELVVSSKGVETANFAATMEQSKKTLDEALVLFKQASNHFAQADNLPQEYSQGITEAKDQVVVLVGVLENLVALEDLYLSFLGNHTKTYLMVFQNYDELRATGGFIGTYGVLKISEGAIKQLKIESIYNLDGSFYEQIAAPGPLQPEIKKWGMRDANWFADFPTTAKLLLRFYEQGKETADGVIATTPRMFEQILDLVGPINMAQYEETLTSENFQEVVQRKTSVEYDKKLNQPKKFLADFAPILLDRLTSLNKEDWFKVMQIITSSFRQKNIMLYSSDQLTQDKIERLGFAGKILDTPHDYLAVINSNLGGTKTDLDIKQSVTLDTKINSDGSIVNRLKITRQNNSEQENKNFMRIMVPYGSVINDVSGFDNLPQFSSTAEGFRTDPLLAEWDKGQMHQDQVFERIESGKTEYSGWIVTKGITQRTISVTYTLPFKLKFNTLSATAPYSLLYQNQAGVQNGEFTGSWLFEDYKAVWHSTNSEIRDNKAWLKADATADRYWSILFSK